MQPISIYLNEFLDAGRYTHEAIAASGEISRKGVRVAHVDYRHQEGASEIVILFRWAEKEGAILFWKASVSECDVRMMNHEPIDHASIIAEGFVANILSGNYGLESAQLIHHGPFIEVLWDSKPSSGRVLRSDT